MNDALRHNLAEPVPDARAVPTRIGPNAIIQVGSALRGRLGVDVARELFEAVSLGPLLHTPPTAMVDERDAARLFRELFQRLPNELATAVSRDAGRRTASYLLAYRIPAAVRLVLRLMPAYAAARLLLHAVAANAWTFAGSGTFQYRAGPPHRLEIADNPIAIPGCVWHVAVFTGLFRALVSPESRVRHSRCCLDSGSVCCFDIETHIVLIPSND